MKELRTNIYRTISWLLPRELVYFCLIRAWVVAATELYPSIDVGEIRAVKMIGAWDKHYCDEGSD